MQPPQQPQTNTFMYNTPAAFNYTQQPQTFTNVAAAAATPTTAQPAVSPQLHHHHQHHIITRMPT
jgi:hypothetical protein